MKYNIILIFINFLPNLITLCLCCIPADVIRQGQYKIPRPIEQLLKDKDKLKEFYANYSLSTSSVTEPLFTTHIPTLSPGQRERLARLERTDKPTVVNVVAGGSKVISDGKGDDEGIVTINGGKVTDALSLSRTESPSEIDPYGGVPHYRYTEQPEVESMVKMIEEHHKSVEGNGYIDPSIKQPPTPAAVVTEGPQPYGESNQWQNQHPQKIGCCGDKPAYNPPAFRSGQRQPQSQAISYYNVVDSSHSIGGFKLKHKREAL